MSRASRARVLAAALVGAVLAGALCANAVAANEEGKATFDQLCQGCHTIGGGSLTGPDLEGLVDRREEAWVKRFILEPDKMIAEGDPIATDLLDEYGVPMPNLGVTEAQIGPLLAFLGFAATGGTTTETTPAETTPTTPTETTPTETTPTPAVGDAERGENLFTGSDRFEAGGPSCLSCHAVAGVGALGGGRLGPRPDGIVREVRRGAGTGRLPEDAPVPDDAPHLLAQGADGGREGRPGRVPRDRPRPAAAREPAGKLIGFSAVAACLLVLLAMGIWRRRLDGVRKPLVEPLLEPEARP